MLYTNLLKHGGEIMPFLIVTYDIDEDRVNKVRKILKKYLNWSQNSVFEGEVTEGILNKCKAELRKVVKTDYDSVYFYRVENPNHLKKETFGVEKNPDGTFL
jgi:CRISPR-associated protein Cas2